MDCYYFMNIFAAAAMMAVPMLASAQGAAPTGLKAEVLGTRVDLSWSRTNPGAALVTNGFERSFPGNGWSVKTTNATDYKCSWFHYPTDEVKMYLQGWEALINKGAGAAVVMSDMGYHEDEPYIQDEWLISPEVENAAYLDFYCYIHPMVLEYGADPEFPDHYYVKVSHDGGESWEILWDARYDSSPLDAYDMVSIPLGDNTGKKTIIAFEAVGDQTVYHDDEDDIDLTQPMYFTWAIDDVTISSDEASSKAARAEMMAKQHTDMSGLNAYREFTPMTGRKVAKAAPAQAPTKAVAGWYNVYYDDALIASDLMSLCYVDETDKTPGKHTYKVTYVDAATKAESAAAEVDVEIEQMPFNPPTNVKVSYTYVADTNSYTAVISWGAPEGDRVPTHYNVYRDGNQIAYEYPEFAYGQSMMPKGVYEYSVSASYKYPSGDSEIVSDVLAIEVRYPAMNLKATEKDNDMVLTWDAPKAEEGYELQYYSVYRGNECLAAECHDLTFTDVDSPEGTYDYSVVAVYGLDEKAPKASTQIVKGDMPLYKLPINEDFEGGMTPANWTVYSSIDRSPYRWLFNNFYEIPEPGSPFSGDFASISSLKSGFTMVKGALYTPIFATDLAEGEHLYVSFDLDYFSKGYPTAEIIYTVDEGGEWVEIEPLPVRLESDIDSNWPRTVTYDLTHYAVRSSMALGWIYESIADGYLAIDNVKIYKVDESGITDIESDANASVEYFNLQGVRVNGELTPGLYIRRQGATANKILVK